ncbi:anaerobic sulfatase maturase [Lacrimispora sp.]|uniref:anaerobic sulfatase maturase n=1 Tax=Lacrimispora sp. TaxID=2719234 RepID=UPI0028AC3F24|nr:anaerobic sulfatase maturase [Lacrimispora sp.]
MPPVNLLIKPASGMCNMQCQYCFYHDITEKRTQGSYGFMSEETLKNVLKKALDYADTACTIAFQGGEPTLAGLPFFEQAVRLSKEYNKKNLDIHFALQTNGFDLGPEWAEFFAREHFLVGISVDGTIHTHDAYRKSGNGSATFLNIMKTVDSFNRYGVEYNILTVVNKRTASSIGKIYQYYKKMGFSYLQFIPCLDPLEAAPGTMEYSLTPELYGQFLCDLFDLWYEDLNAGKEIYIRQFYNYLSLLLTGNAESCDMNGFCSIQNVIEADGEVYPCDFFVLDEFKLGNLNNTGFDEIHKKRMEIGFLSSQKAPDSQCQACSYFSLCRGGCYRHRIMSMEETCCNYFCKSYQMFFDHCLPRLLQTARKFNHS